MKSLQEWKDENPGRPIHEYYRDVALEAEKSKNSNNSPNKVEENTSANLNLRESKIEQKADDNPIREKGKVLSIVLTTESKENKNSGEVLGNSLKITLAVSIMSLYLLFKDSSKIYYLPHLQILIQWSVVIVMLFKFKKFDELTINNKIIIWSCSFILYLSVIEDILFFVDIINNTYNNYPKDTLYAILFILNMSMIAGIIRTVSLLPAIFYLYELIEQKPQNPYQFFYKFVFGISLILLLVSIIFIFFP